MISFKEQGARRAVVYLDRMMSTRDRSHLTALPDAMAISLRLEASQLAGTEAQIGEFLIGFKETMQVAFEPAKGSA